VYLVQQIKLKFNSTFEIIRKSIRRLAGNARYSLAFFQIKISFFLTTSKWAAIIIFSQFSPEIKICLQNNEEDVMRTSFLKANTNICLLIFSTKFLRQKKSRENDAKKHLSLQLIVGWRKKCI